MLPAQPKTIKDKDLEYLRQKIRQLEGYRGITRIAQTGLEAIQSGVTHEFISHTPPEAAATAGFLSALLARLAGDKGTIVWIVKTKTVHAAGLLPFGLAPERIIFAHVPQDRDALWAMEECLRCKQLSAVVGEIREADLTATRRLQLAAEVTGATGFLLRHDPKRTNNTACATRWRIRPAPGVTDHLPGLGAPAWHAELLRARGSPPEEWQFAWQDGEIRTVKPTAKPQPVKLLAVGA